MGGSMAGPNYRRLVVINCVLVTPVLRLDEKLIAHLAFGMARGYDYIKFSTCSRRADPPIHFLFLLDTGLDFIHKRYSVHRDVKPGNVLVHTNGMIKIAGQNVKILLGNFGSMVRV